MRKILVLLLFFFTQGHRGVAQSSTSVKNNFPNRAGDHFMIQLSSDHWLGAPDSITNRQKGISRGANVYLMLDKPFKGNPKMSVAFGLGISASNIYFQKLSAEINGTAALLNFKSLDGQDYFKKYKVSTTYAEVPLELRFTADPAKPNKTVKAAIGVKIGTLLNAHTKGKTLQNSAGKTISEYTQKIIDKRYFTGTRIAATARVGYGCFSLFGSYGITGVFKDNVAADIHALQVGLTISGL